MPCQRLRPSFGDLLSLPLFSLASAMPGEWARLMAATNKRFQNSLKPSNITEIIGHQLERNKKAMNKTKIEYLDYTWNPIAMRCTPVSDGCRNCWHLAMVKRLAKNPSISKTEREAYAGGPPFLRNLNGPDGLRKSSIIGVQLMGDLFHSSITYEQRVEIIEVMEMSNHIFLILTKRSQEMKDFFCELFDGYGRPNHIWLGVSVEDQKIANERIPILLQIPTTHRWVSVEPMLGPVDIYPTPMHQGSECLDWVVCGGETGPKARPLSPDWVRSLRDQCQAAGVPFFFKGWGDYNRRAQGLQFVGDPGNTGRLLDGREWNEIPK